MAALAMAQSAGNIDFGGDCALYMVLNAWKPFQTGFSGTLRVRKIASETPQNLDATGLSPYTSAVPGNGHDFGPPRGAMMRLLVAGMEEDF